MHRGHRLVLETARFVGRDHDRRDVLAASTARAGEPGRACFRPRASARAARARGLASTRCSSSTFTPEVAGLEPAEFAETVLRRIGATTVVVGENFRFGRGAAGDGPLLEQLGLRRAARPAARGRLVDADPLAAAGGRRRRGGASCSAVPRKSRASSCSATSAEGRSATRRPTWRCPPDLLVPAYGIYAGSALGHRAAISIGVNPHYGGDERRIEPYLLDFEGDLYGAAAGGRALAPAPGRAGVRVRGGARRPDRKGRRGDPRGRAAGLINPGPRGPLGS